MIRETIGEQLTVPEEGYYDEKNLKDSSIQYSFPLIRCNNGKDPENSGRYPAQTDSAGVRGRTLPAPYSCCLVLPE
jgi:hypothetical protein